MPGRPIINETDLLRAGYSHPDFVQRRLILHETLQAFSSAKPPDKYQKLAADNLRRWQIDAQQNQSSGQVLVISGDWGEVTRALTKKYGVCFAVLNMANAYVPGGAYVEGAPAQEENMFRRTDCHFHVCDKEYDDLRDRYLPEMTQLISAENGLVYLDTDYPRICIRGSENRSRHDLGYPWLPEHEVFPFFELRAAAQDLRGGLEFDPDEARRRIAAQLITLQNRGIRHAVLGASGCGAFENPPRDIAKIYREEINARRTDFVLIAFAILESGHGSGSFTPFDEVFRD